MLLYAMLRAEGITTLLGAASADLRQALPRDYAEVARRRRLLADVPQVHHRAGEFPRPAVMVGGHDVWPGDLVQVLLFRLHARLLTGYPAERADRLVAALDDVLPGVHLGGDLAAARERHRLHQRRRGHLWPHAHLRPRDRVGRGALPWVLRVAAQILNALSQLVRRRVRALVVHTASERPVALTDRHVLEVALGGEGGRLRCVPLQAGADGRDLPVQLLQLDG